MTAVMGGGGWAVSVCDTVTCSTGTPSVEGGITALFCETSTKLAPPRTNMTARNPAIKRSRRELRMRVAITAGTLHP